MFDKQMFEVAPGINYEYVYKSAMDPLQPTFLFLHGFPSSFYCWRHQIKHFSDSGYGCLAPNLMGYGSTYSPIDSNKYKIKSMIDHLIKLLDYLSLERVIVVGHDWGTRPATRMAIYHPERLYGLILLSVGYHPPRKFDFQQTLTLSKQALGYESLGYWQFFTADDAEKIIQENVESFIDLGYTDTPILWKTDFAPLGRAREWLSQAKRCPRASFLTEDDIETLRKLINEGMQSKLNWYCAAIDDVDWEDEKNLDPNLTCSVLFIAGEKDFICVPALFQEQGKFITKLEVEQLDTSHWIMEEKPKEVNQIIESWVDKLQ